MFISADPPALGTPHGASVPVDALLAAAEAVARLGACSADYDALTDAELLVGQRDVTRLRAQLDSRSVWIAKAVAYRSRRELGQAGLAAQRGFHTPDALIQDLTGSSKADARRLVGVGRMLADTEAATRAQADGPDATDYLALEPVEQPWHAPISNALADGTLSVAAAHAIRTGLGDIDTVVTGPILADAVATLLDEARTLNVDELLKRSRRMRDSLDAAGIAVREQKAWDDRYLRIWKLPTGQVCINGLFPPEQGEFILSTQDSLTGPRRGGVHFVDPDRAAWARAVQDDQRSTDQITADTFIDLLRAGTSVNPNRMLGGRKPAVRILKVHQPTDRPGRVPAARSGAGPARPPTDHPRAWTTSLFRCPTAPGTAISRGTPHPCTQRASTGSSATPAPSTSPSTPTANR